MCGIESQAAFYRGYLTGDQSLKPLRVALAMIVALWSLVYLAGSFAPPAKEPAADVATQWSSLAGRHMTP